MLKHAYISLSLTGTLLLGLFLLTPVVSAEEQHGGDIWFKDTKKMPHVLFSHEKHLKAGNQCEDCHKSIFQKKKGSTDEDHAMTMKVMKRGKLCGTCHDGVKAFKVGRSCKKCHIKGKEDAPKSE
jgi:c(7)-type cytochrome triheme protein